MLKYFFHLHNHLESRDREGKFLPDLNAAREVAISAARDIMSNNIKDGELCLSHRIEVEDASGRKVLVLRFGEALSILP
ncbi:DUF6894 family protein [Sphingomonas sp. LaA6.9]|uniref:DUF6894 family protein n=1 Tax=Sphingomonas sp. LaA6.9 TaxID=2919914 RepID=UPI001F501F83|nr:hypothetical protein [Sphingomonas sp. LaA6.9]MCJ8156617.1 hypothetical protein [Sphingomonas sp. LaA6.9]